MSKFWDGSLFLVRKFWDSSEFEEKIRGRNDLNFELSQSFRTEKVSHLKILTRDQNFEQKLKRNWIVRILSYLKITCTRKSCRNFRLLNPLYSLKQNQAKGYCERYQCAFVVIKFNRVALLKDTKLGISLCKLSYTSYLKYFIATDFAWLLNLLIKPTW